MRIPGGRTLVAWLWLPAFAVASLCIALWSGSARADIVCDYENGLPKNCRQVPGSGGGSSPDCDWDCKEANRQQMRHYRAAKANGKGAEAHRRGEFIKARGFYNEALRHIPGYGDAVTNLNLLNRQERYYNFAWGLDAYNRGKLDKARGFFGRALALAENEAMRSESEQWLRHIDKLSRYKPGGSLMMLGTGAQIGWNVPTGSHPAIDKATAERVIGEQLDLARRELPAGVDLTIYNMGLGIAATTSEFNDLFIRVLADQWTKQPVPRSGMGGYNTLTGRRFDLLGCHSNGAMTCLLALSNEDAMARDVVLYGPQLTPEAAILWQDLLRANRIRSLRIVLNSGDPIPPLAMAINMSPWSFKRALLFNGPQLKATVAELVPSAQIDLRSCSFRPTKPFACHYMTAYPQCRAVTPPRQLVPGTRGFLDQNYTEPPPPKC